MNKTFFHQKSQQLKLKSYKYTVSDHHYLPITAQLFSECNTIDDIIQNTLKPLLLILDIEQIQPYILGTHFKHNKIWIVFDKSNFQRTFHSLILNETPSDFLFSYYAFNNNSFKNNEVLSSFPEKNAFQFSQLDLKEYMRKNTPSPCISFEETSLTLVVNIKHFYSSHLPTFNPVLTSHPIGRIEINSFYFRKIFKHNCPINYIKLIAKDPNYIYFSIPESYFLHFITHSKNFYFELIRI